MARTRQVDGNGNVSYKIVTGRMELGTVHKLGGRWRAELPTGSWAPVGSVKAGEAWLATYGRGFSTSCVDCGGAITGLTAPAPDCGMSCGKGPCHAAHNDRAEQARSDGARRAAETRRERAETALAGPVGDGSWVMIGALNGLRLDGRRAAKLGPTPDGALI